MARTYKPTNNTQTNQESSARNNTSAVPVRRKTHTRQGLSQPVPFLQAKLSIGSVDSPMEREADAVADKVMSMPDSVAHAGSPAVDGGAGATPVQRQELQRNTLEEDKLVERKPLIQRQSPDMDELERKPLIQRRCVTCENEDRLNRIPLIQRQNPDMDELERKPLIQRLSPDMDELERKPLIQRHEGSSTVPAVTPEISSSVYGLRGKGQPMSAADQSFFAPRMPQVDVSQVRVHSDTSAQQLARSVDARAFTFENNVVMGKGEYAPGTSAGRRLMAHELTHVAQQGAAPGKTVARKPVQGVIQRLAPPHKKGSKRKTYEELMAPDEIMPGLVTDVQRIGHAIEWYYARKSVKGSIQNAGRNFTSHEFDLLLAYIKKVNNLQDLGRRGGERRIHDRKVVVMPSLAQAREIVGVENNQLQKTIRVPADPRKMTAEDRARVEIVNKILSTGLSAFSPHAIIMRILFEALGFRVTAFGVGVQTSYDIVKIVGGGIGAQGVGFYDLKSNSFMGDGFVFAQGGAGGKAGGTYGLLVAARIERKPEEKDDAGKSFAGWYGAASIQAVAGLSGFVAPAIPINFSAWVGFVFLLGPKVGLDFSIGYAHRLPVREGVLWGLEKVRQMR